MYMYISDLWWAAIPVGILVLMIAFCLLEDNFKGNLRHLYTNITYVEVEISPQENLRARPIGG